MAFREIGRAHGLWPQEKLTPRAPDIFLDLGAAGAVSLSAPFAGSEVAAPASGGFDMAAIRPGREQPSFAERSPQAASGSWGGAVSAILHVAILAALLTWATPTVETAPPEPVTIDIVPDMPASVAPESPPAPPTAETPPPPPVAEPSPAPVAETQPPPPVVEPSPPPVAETPPPPPVVEPSPTPAAETPPPPPVVEPTPPPVAETPPPPPAVEPSPPPVAETPPPPPAAASPPPVAETPPPPPAAASPPPVAEWPPPPPVTKTSPPPLARAPPPKAVVETPPRVPKPPPPARRPTPRVAKPAPPEKERRRLSREPPDSSPSATKATGPTSTPPRSAASSADVAAYQGEVLGRIAAQKRYPEAARERAPQGVAIVRFSIAASGQLAGASLSRSAGDPLLDAEALATVRRASPFPPPPAGAPRNFSVPLSYRVR